MKCKDCMFWENESKHKKRLFKIGECANEPFDVADMDSDTFAITYGHDGSIYTGEDFGCIKFVAKQ